QETRTVPIIFAIVTDPVGCGYVASLSRPGGNASGFMQFDNSLSGKWLELLKQIAPNVTRVAVLWDPTVASAIGQFAVIQSVAPSLGVDVRPINVSNTSETERAIAGFGSQPNGGLIVTGSALTISHRELINMLAAKHKLPAVVPNRFYITDGALISYGVDFIDQHRRAAVYVDRILKGEKPADLPVQAPTKYELVVNLKAAKTLGIAVPPALLAQANDVIEQRAEKIIEGMARCPLLAQSGPLPWRPAWLTDFGPLRNWWSRRRDECNFLRFGSDHCTLHPGIRQRPRLRRPESLARSH